MWVLETMAAMNICAAGLVSSTSTISGSKNFCVPTIRFHGDVASRLHSSGFSTSEVRVPLRRRLACLAGKNYDSMTVPTAEQDSIENAVVPIPKVVIDQDSEPNATVVELTFGDRLGALLDTMESLRDLGLNVIKAKVSLDSSGKHNTFFITRTDTGRKVDDPELLQQIRLTIINNLIEYHPESSIQLAMGAVFGIIPPKEMSQVDVDIATHIHIYDDGPKRSLLCIETADRPGLLVEIVKMLLDISVAVQSGEFDTEGLLGKAKFHVSYQDTALTKSMKQVVANSLRYYIRRPATEESSF